MTRFQQMRAHFYELAQPAPEFMKYVALILAAVYFVFWLFGGLWFSQIGNTQIYYWAGWVTLLAYLPFYWYRTKVEDVR